MKTSEQIDQLATALAKAQGQMKNPEKNKTATIPMKAGGKYSYNYADFPCTIDCLRKPLADNGLSHSATVYFTETGAPMLSMRLMHASGQWIESDYDLPTDVDEKGFAASLSYGRRYLFNGLMGIAADEDTEDQPEDGATYTPRQRRPAAPQASPSTQTQAKPQTDTRTPSDAQLKRLFTISKQANWTEEELKRYLNVAYGIDSTKKLTMEQYNQLCESALPQGSQAALAKLHQNLSSNNSDYDPNFAGDANI